MRSRFRRQYSHYPPEVQRRWRIVEAFGQYGVLDMLEWEFDLVSYLTEFLKLYCDNEEVFGPWPLCRLSPDEISTYHIAGGAAIARWERRLAEKGAILARGSRPHLKKNWRDPETGTVYRADAIDLSPLDSLAARLEVEGPKLSAEWRRRCALLKRLEVYESRIRERIRIAVGQGALDEQRASEIEAQLPSLRFSLSSKTIEDLWRIQAQCKAVFDKFRLETRRTRGV